MNERMRCALNGAEMTLLDPRLYIQDIEEQIKMNILTAERPGYGLTPLGTPEREQLNVLVRFVIKEKRRMERTGIISRVNAWAKEGWLTVSTRPEQRLYVRCTQPAGSQALPLNGEMLICFTAYDEAYWQDQYAVSASASGTGGSVILRPRGTRKCRLEAEIINQSGDTVNNLTLRANGGLLAFEGLGLEAGQALRLYHDGRRLLHADAGDKAALDCRRADSADELLLMPGRENTVEFTADGRCGVTLRARGEYD
ncbi:MAG: hypothetical protein IJ214_12385 [Clostridia bacterium]|nr:hypothetical protein [Clostridia bacterium]